MLTLKSNTHEKHSWMRLQLDGWAHLDSLGWALSTLPSQFSDAFFIHSPLFGARWREAAAAAAAHNCRVIKIVCGWRMTVILVDDGAGNGPHRSHVPHMLRWLVFAVIRLTRPPAINKMEMVGLCVFTGKKMAGRWRRRPWSECYDTGHRKILQHRMVCYMKSLFCVFWVHELPIRIVRTERRPHKMQYLC